MSEKCEGYLQGSKVCGKPAVGVIRKGGREWKVCKNCQGGARLVKKLT